MTRLSSKSLMSHGSRLLASVAVAAVVVTSAARAQETDDHRDDTAVDRVDEDIIVVGTNLRRGGTIGPVSIISSEDISRSGALSMHDVLRSLPQDAGAGTDQMTASFTTAGTGSGATNLSRATAPNLRGLGSRYTVSLINGGRPAVSGAEQVFDISQLPIAAIERVEVLSDSASAIYGADAIGGVVNFVLRKRFDGAQLSSSFGAADGGYEQQLDSMLMGGDWGDREHSGSAVLAYEYFSQQPLSLADRPNLSPGTPDRYLAPEQERNSIFLELNQELGEGLHFDAVAVGSRQALLDHMIQLFGSEPSVDYPVDTKQGTVLASIQKDWAGDWTTRVTFGGSIDQFDFRRLSDGILTTRQEDSSRSDSANLTTSGSVSLGLNRRISFAVGGEHRHDAYESSVLEAPELGVHGRDVDALFAEARTTLIGNSEARSGFVEMNMAARWDNYSDVGEATSPHIGIRWKPLQSLELSSTWGKGFRAPALSDLFGSSALIVYPANAFADSASPTGRNQTPVAALAGSNADLKPEESESFLVSATWSPTNIPGLRSRLTYYTIDISNSISALPNVTNLADPRFADYVVRNPTSAQVLAAQSGATQFIDASGGAYDPANTWALVDARSLNFASRHVSGIDGDVSYTWNIGLGVATAGASLSYIDELSFTSLPGTAEQSLVGTTFYPSHLSGRITTAYTRDAFNASLAVNFVDGYKNSLVEGGPRVDAWTTADLHLGLDFGALSGNSSPGDGFEAGLTIRNITDEMPPHVDGVGASQNIGFDPANANAFGRTFTLELRKRF